MKFWKMICWTMPPKPTDSVLVRTFEHSAIQIKNITDLVQKSVCLQVGESGYAISSWPASAGYLASMLTRVAKVDSSTTRQLLAPSVNISTDIQHYLIMTQWITIQYYMNYAKCGEIMEAYPAQFLPFIPLLSFSEYFLCHVDSQHNLDVYRQIVNQYGCGDSHFLHY